MFLKKKSPELTMTTEMIEKFEKEEAERKKEKADQKAWAEKSVRMQHLCTLTAACLQSMTMAGLYSLDLSDKAIETAESLLKRIEEGPSENQE